MKKAFRKSALLRRSSIPAELRALKSRKIMELVLALPLTARAGIISVYIDFRSEVETRALIRRLMDEGKTIALPVVHYDTWELKFKTISSLDSLVQTPKLIWEPAPGTGKDIMIQDIDLILTPGAAFDYQGNRMGYGAGFYDRVLKQRREDTQAIGLAFIEQVVEAVPIEAHDQKVNAIVTDTGVIEPSSV